MKVELIDAMGSDLSVVRAARVSFQKETDWEYAETNWDRDFKRVLSERDTKLIHYLARNNHWTPFGHCFASFRIKAPLFVARQLGKHQVGLCWNEVSRRYVDSEPEFYVPSEWRARADNVKQGSSEEAVDESDYLIRRYHFDILERTKSFYEYLLDKGVCPEMARIVLPQSTLSEWVWSGSLAAFARVCKLRLDPHAQKETRDVAQMMFDELSPRFPVSWDALMKS